MNLPSLILGVFETPAAEFDRYGRSFDCAEIRFKPVSSETKASYLNIRVDNKKYRVHMPVVPLYDFTILAEADILASKVYRYQSDAGVLTCNDYVFVKKWRAIVYGLMWSRNDNIELVHNLTEEAMETIRIGYFEGQLKA